MNTLLVGKKAPTFKAQAVAKQQIIHEFTLDLLTEKYIIFFFYPLDFTFVCPTELHAFQDRLEEFNQLGAEIVGCSVDSVYSHLAWINTSKNKGGIQGISYPIVSDLNKSIARDYGVLSEDGIAYRGLFLIDKQGIVRHQLVNDLSLGRSIDETLRLLNAVIFHEQHGEVCPANWVKGSKSMKPSQEGLVAYFN